MIDGKSRLLPEDAGSRITKACDKQDIKKAVNTFKYPLPQTKMRLSRMPLTQSPERVMDVIYYKCHVFKILQDIIPEYTKFSNKYVQQLYTEYAHLPGLELRLEMLSREMRFSEIPNGQMQQQHFRTQLCYDEIEYFFSPNSRPNLLFICSVDRITRAKSYELYRFLNTMDLQEVSQLIDRSLRVPQRALSTQKFEKRTETFPVTKQSEIKRTFRPVSSYINRGPVVEELVRPVSQVNKSDVEKDRRSVPYSTISRDKSFKSNQLTNVHTNEASNVILRKPSIPTAPSVPRIPRPMTALPYISNGPVKRNFAIQIIPPRYSVGTNTKSHSSDQHKMRTKKTNNSKSRSPSLLCETTSQFVDTSKSRAELKSATFRENHFNDTPSKNIVTEKIQIYSSLLEKRLSANDRPDSESSGSSIYGVPKRRISKHS